MNREYYLDDGLGNIRAITDSSGNSLDTLTYDPYGNQLTGTSSAEFKYKSEQLNSDTELYYMRARYYDQNTGTFISKDPLEGELLNPQSQNGYSFSGGDPINFSDPSGMDFLDINLSVGVNGFNAGGGALLNTDGITFYVNGGASTPGKGIMVTYNQGDPVQNDTTANYSIAYGPAVNVSYPYTNGAVPLTSGTVSRGFGTPGVSATINHTFNTICFK